MIRAFQWDLARQVERLDWLQSQLSRYADWGYEELYLHLEDAVEYPRLPGVARRDAYTYQQLSQLVAAATRAGVKVVPIVNLLGHTQYLIKHPDLRDLNELRAADGSPLERGQICPLHPRTLEVAEKLLADMRPFCTAGKVHVGLDESFHLGKHPLSRQEIAQVGLAGHFAGYVQRLHGLTASMGLRMGIWADMLCFLPEAIPLLPRGLIAYDWYYYPFRRLPRVEMFNFKPYDLAAPLKAHGIEYWGCPMNGSFRHEPLPLFRDRLGNIRQWWRRCQQTNAGGLLVTSWEPSRLALEMTTVVDAAAACLWQEPGNSSDAGMLTAGFERACGLDRSTARNSARAALRCDSHPFTGYARWEMNERWDVVSSRESMTPYVKGERFYRALERQRLPESLSATVSFLHYLHAREVFVRQAVRDVFQLRRALFRQRPLAPLLAKMQSHAHAFSAVLMEGRRAARAMWRFTRDNRECGPNELVLRADAARLRSWLSWLKRCAHSPGLADGPSVMTGALQLQLNVLNFAPALQKIMIEQRGSDGMWRELRGRFTIEFSAEGAGKYSRVKRALSVAVDRGDVLTPALRVSIRGLGQVKISDVELTDGITVNRPRKWPRGQARGIGQKAPPSGFPLLQWDTNADSLELSFDTSNPPAKKRTLARGADDFREVTVRTR